MAIETRLSNIERETSNHRVILVGNGKNIGLISEVANLKAAETKNQEVRSWVYSVRDQIKGAKLLAGIILSALTVAGGVGYLTVWKALQEIIKALP